MWVLRSCFLYLQNFLFPFKVVSRCDITSEISLTPVARKLSRNHTTSTAGDIGRTESLQCSGYHAKRMIRGYLILDNFSEQGVAKTGISPETYRVEFGLLTPSCGGKKRTEQSASLLHENTHKGPPPLPWEQNGSHGYGICSASPHERCKSPPGSLVECSAATRDESRPTKNNRRLLKPFAYLE